MTLLALLLLLSAVSCLVLAVRARNKDIADEGEGELAPEDGGGGLRALGAMLRPQGDRSLADLKGRTSHAGLYGQDALDLYLSVRLIILMLGLGAGGLALAFHPDTLTGGAVAIMLAGFSILGPGLWLDQRARRRQGEISEELPQVLSLLVVSLEAGLNLQQALERVTTSGRGRDSVLVSELRLVLGDLKLGLSLDNAFRRFATRTGSEEAKSLAGVIGWGSQLGTRIAEVLGQHVDAMRHNRLMALEEKSGKSSAKLALPLTLCLLPAAILVLVGPSFLSLLSNL
ncbi:MAG: type II secretion system F family protein [Myxococcales bacterium]|nr:type II secretion system F family protein [Myxococcales bacterium]